jgi:hypothetical protein
MIAAIVALHQMWLLSGRLDVLSFQDTIDLWQSIDKADMSAESVFSSRSDSAAHHS